MTRCLLLPLSFCLAACPRATEAPADASTAPPSVPSAVAPPPSAPAASANSRRFEAEARRAITPSILRLDLGAQSHATAFACVLPGLACTAKHVLGDASSIVVKAHGQPPREVPVVGIHPEDDVALLDIRALGPIPPLAVTLLDVPVDGIIVCRLGHPPSHPDRPFARCDPTAGILIESTEKKDGSANARLVHLGIGLKGDSGSPLYDPGTGLVVGVHVAEANGSGRAAMPSAIHDLRLTLGGSHPWLKGCETRAPTELARRTLLLGCLTLGPEERANHYRQIGAAMLALGRRAEALSAFDEALEVEPHGAAIWLWRALVFPGSAHARDDAAFAFRLDPVLRQDAALREILPAMRVASARALRDEVAPAGARLATLIGPGACAACPEFCAAAEKARDVRLWAVEGANHPAAESLFRTRAGAKAGGVTLLALDDKIAVGCGSLQP